MSTYIRKNKNDYYKVIIKKYLIPFFITCNTNNIILPQNVMAKGAKNSLAKSDMSSPMKGGGGPVQKYKPTPSPKKKDERCKPIQMVQLMVGHFTISMMPRKSSKASLTEMA